VQKIWKYFKMAGSIATSKKDRRTYLLGAVAIRGDGCIVKSANGPSPVPAREAHAEYKLCKKLDHGATVLLPV